MMTTRKTELIASNQFNWKWSNELFFFFLVKTKSLYEMSLRCLRESSDIHNIYNVYWHLWKFVWIKKQNVKD